MIEIKELLRYVQRTNPDMTEEKLREELSKSTYSSMAILFTMENVKKKFSAQMKKCKFKIFKKNL